MTYWCAVQTHVRAEDKAAFHLRRQGYDVFLPKHLKRRKHARRIDWVSAPLFPRYLFVAIDPETTPWWALKLMGREVKVRVPLETVYACA
jgi:transcriptional antiterminator RfaH